MPRQESIIVLVCYFGKFPWYFNLFLHSCRYNSSIQFCILTDNEDKFENKPKNVFFIKKSLKEIEKLTSEKLGFKTILKTAYKICDYRPLLGYLFPDLIKNYTFWGYGDIDVIYGDLRYFLTNKLLNSYDVISMRPEYLTGSFTLYRNSKNVTTLFFESKDYKKIFSSADYFNFDECNFKFGFLQAGLPIDSFDSPIESMTHVVKKKHKEGFIKAYFDFHLVEGRTGNIKWHNGKITYKNKIEAIMYHFLEFKKMCKSKSVLKGKPDTLYISQNNIYRKYKPVL